MRNIVSEDYFNYLYNIVCDVTASIKYVELLHFLYDTKFEYDNAMDENRANNGIDLRYRFAMDCQYSKSEIDAYIGYMPCNMLEMMIGLALSIEEHIMDDPTCGNRTGQWFWNMITSLGLSGMCDGQFNEWRATEVMNRFVDRNYKRNGEGGLFTISDNSIDMRELEIWHQAMCYLNDNYDFRL